MYVRWQRQRSRARDERQRERNDARPRLKAVLVETVRVDGKPRQKHIAFLGSVSIDGRDIRRFWYDVTTRLDRLGNRVSAEECERIGAAIAERVGGRLMTALELEQFEQDLSDLGVRLRSLRPG